MAMSDSESGIKKPNPLWQMYIQEGNVHMHDGLYSQAQTAYILAMEVAEKLLTNALQKQNDPDAINVFIISCQNLAEVNHVMGLTKDAERLLLEAHSRCLEVMETKYLSMQFRTEAYRAFEATFMVLVEFYRKTECHQRMAEIITESKLHRQEFLQEIHRIFESD